MDKKKKEIYAREMPRTTDQNKTWEWLIEKCFDSCDRSNGLCSPRINDDNNYEKRNINKARLPNLQIRWQKSGGISKSYCVHCQISSLKTLLKDKHEQR